MSIKKINLYCIISTFCAFFCGESKSQDVTITKKIQDSIQLTVIPTPKPLVDNNTVVFPSILKNNEQQAADYVQKFSMNKRDYIINMAKKGKKIFPAVAKTFTKNGIPTEFKVLVAMESAFQPKAVSCAGAVGYWQIMDEVANQYGMNHVHHYTATEKRNIQAVYPANVSDSLLSANLNSTDDRKDLKLSTKVAAKYLKDRHINLGNNWLLIAASYNCGIGNVWNCIRRSGKSNPTFWDIKKFLPMETQNYVMNFIALNVVFNNYNKFLSKKLSFKAFLSDNDLKKS